MAEATSFNARSPRHTQFSGGVAADLEEIGFEHERDVPVFAGMFANVVQVDMADRERKIAVECEGKRRYLTEPGGGEEVVRETGAARAKRRLLHGAGWKVVSLPWYVNEELEEQGRRREWLDKKLRKAGWTPSSERTQE